MIEEISSLLFQTFSAQGDDANAQIQNASQLLDGYGGNLEFCQCLFQIIQSDQVPQGIKRSAIIYLKNMILHHWSEGIPPESKELIINSLPSILLNISEASYPLLNKLAASVVQQTFFTNEWNTIPQIIFSGFEAKDEGHFLLSLILLNSISLLFSKIDDNHEKYHLFSELSTQFLTFLTNYISESPLLFHVSICFKIARHFSSSQIAPVFISQPETLQIWILRALKMSQPTEDPNYEMFALASLKFLTLLFFRYDMSLLPPEIPMCMLNSVVELINTGPNMKLLGKCAYFLKLTITGKKNSDFTWPGIMSDLKEFIKNVILPFFILTPQDIDDAINDPSAFVQNFHAICMDDSDPRAVLSHALEMKGQVCNELCTVLVSLLNSIIPLRSPEYDQITYSVCYLFSTISVNINNPEQVASFCSVMMPLFQSQSFIVRCGALLAFRDMKNIPPPIVLSTFAMLSSENEMLIIKYYAAIALSSFLTNIDNQTADIIRNEMDGKTVSEVVKSYFLLAQEFNDYDFVMLIKSYIAFFGPNLTHIAPSFVAETYSMFLNFSKKESESKTILSSLSKYLELLAQTSQEGILNETINYLLNEIINTLKSNILLPHAIIAVADLVANIMALSPAISELHWQILILFSELIQFSSANSKIKEPSIKLARSVNCSFTSVSHSFLLEAVCIAYKNLIIKDKETTRKPEVANGLTNTALSMVFCNSDIKEAGPAFSFLATLLIILAGSQVIDISDLYNKLVPMVVNCLSANDIMSYASILFGAMIIFNSDYLFEIIKDTRSQILLKWANSVSNKTSSAFITTINKKCQSFSNDEIIMLISKAIQILDNSSIGESLFNDDSFLLYPDYIELQQLSLFSESHVLEEFANLLNTINSTCPEIIQHIQSNFEKPILQILSIANSQSCS